MKKSIRKVLAATVATLTLTALSATSFLSVAAQEPVTAPVSQPVAVAQADGESISPQASDVIVTRYRYYSGRWQYRRWNETKQIWVDSDWIDV